MDPSTGDVHPEGEDEEYPLDEIEVGFADYTKPNPLPDFRAAWDAMTPDFDLTQVRRRACVFLCVCVYVCCVSVCVCASVRLPCCVGRHDSQF